MEESFILNHLGEERKNYYNAVSPPIIQSSNFVFDDLQSFREAIADEKNATIYTRGNNPTVAILRKKLAALESAEDALVLSSGVAAISAAIMANVKSGDHIVCVEHPYSWTNKLLSEYLPRFNVSHTFVDGTSIAAIEKAIQKNTTVLYLESPNSLTFELQDLPACTVLAKQHNLVTIIDNSYCSPLYQKPIEMGIDIVVHSATKYINGHSDVVVGVICGSEAMMRKIFEQELMNIGHIISPNDAMLVIRGLRTLPLRMEQSDKSAHKIVAWLEAHPKVEKVLYPFSKNFAQYELAKRQMSGAGGLFTMVLKCEKMEEAEQFFHALKHFLLAVSWGGHESLVMPSCAFYNVPGREDSYVPWNYFRFYIGLEDADFLIADLEQAFAQLPV